MKYFIILFFSLLLYSCGLTIVIPKDKKEKKNNERIANHKHIKRSKVPRSREEYISMYKEMAMDKMEKYNIPASITLAQGILESGAGKSELAVNANNHFGIKCGSSWDGMVYYKDDDKKNDCFRVYNKVDYSFDDHSKVLLNSRYKRLFDLDIKDYKGWAKTIRECGYATNPKYPQILISIVERYKLYKYDNLVLGEDIKKSKEKNNSTKKNIKKKPEKVIKKDEIVRKTLTSFITSKSKEIKKYTVKKGDTLYGISKRNKISVDEIKRLNKLKGNSISVGQELILKK